MRVHAILLAIPVLLAAAPPAIRFEDASAGSGLDFVLHNSPTARKYLPETMAGGIAAFDYNNDGRIDLFFANGASLPSLRKTGPEYANRLYRNDGGGHFTDVTEELGLSGSGYSMGAAAADFDNDGFVDLFVAGVGECHLYKNEGGKRFRDVTAQSGIHCGEWAVAGGWFDYDRDGLLDLFVVNYLKWAPATNPVCHDPSGRYVVYCHPKEFAGTANMLYRNLGGGKFEDVSAASGIAKSVGKGMSLAIADYDGDGYPDVFVTNDTLPNFLFHNLRDGHFKESAFDAGVALRDDGKPVSSMGADFRDFNNDGRPDILFTALAGETFPLFRNLGQGEFQDATYASGLGRLTSRLSSWGVALADLNNDGWKDIFSANSHVTDNIELFSGDRYRQADAVFVNRGDGTFADASAESAAAFRTPRAHRGAVIADFDGDGKLDAVVSVLGERPEFWRNASPGSGHWLELKLIGSRSNRDGIGARIHLVDSRGGDQWNEVTSSAGYASSTLAPVHFGLRTGTGVSLRRPLANARGSEAGRGGSETGRIGTEARSAPEGLRIEIEWPSATRQVLENVRAGQVLTVREPVKK